jgi:GTP-binding protein EngB required for normal cell division
MSVPNPNETRPAHEHEAAVLTAEVIDRFGLSDLEPLLHSMQRHQSKTDLNIAVLGRFKAGKSSFLNHLIGKAILPVGVLPVTSVITEICYGEDEHAELVAVSGVRTRITVTQISDYVAESENPHNKKGVELVRVYLPSLARFRGITFVDTPGLESVFQHNTETSISWTPNVDLALVAVGVDPPLTQQDISLIARLLKYTPHVCVLLTKVDTLSENERQLVETFVKNRLREQFSVTIPIFPYSIRPGFESLRRRFETEQILHSLAFAHVERKAILDRKLGTLLHSAQGYLELAEKAAAKTALERENLKQNILGANDLVADKKLQLQLLAKHAAGKTRSTIESYLNKDIRGRLEQQLKEQLAAELPTWHGGFSTLLSLFGNWLRRKLTNEIADISNEHQSAFCEPLRTFQAQCQRSLQAFRDQLSDAVMRVYGVPLRTSETEIEVQPPRSPSISIGNVFDHSWEIISFLIPMPLVRWAVERRFYGRVEEEVYKNLSRLTTQWEEKIQAAIFQAGREAERRLDQLVATVDRLLSSEEADVRDEVRSYIKRVKEAVRLLA